MNLLRKETIGKYIQDKGAVTVKELGALFPEVSLMTIHRDLDLKKIAEMVKTRIEIFPDIKDLVDFFEAVPEYDASMYCHKKMKTNEETSLTVLKEALPVLEAQEDYTNDPLFASLSEFVKEKGYKNGYVMWPLRTAVSGKQMTPAGATEIMEIIGKEETLRRVNAAIEKLENL